MKNSNDSKSLAGLIIGIIGMLISIFPCIGFLGSLLAIVGLILSYLGYRSDKAAGASATMSILGMVFSAIAIIITIAYSVFFAGFTSEIADGGLYKDKVYTSCDDILVDYETEVLKIESFEDKENDVEVNDFSNVMQTTINIITLTKKIEDMNCESDSNFLKKYEALENRVD